MVVNIKLMKHKRSCLYKNTKSLLFTIKELKKKRCLYKMKAREKFLKKKIFKRRRIVNKFSLKAGKRVFILSE